MVHAIALGLNLSATPATVSSADPAGNLFVYYGFWPDTHPAEADYLGEGVNVYTDRQAFDHTVAAGVGGQVITLGDGNDVVEVGNFNSRPGDLPVIDDRDQVDSGGGIDWIRTGAGSDVIGAGAGDDLVFSDGAASSPQTHSPQDAEAGDIVDGGSGQDNLFGSFGSDLLYGGIDNDSLFGMEGSDVLIGGDGDDGLNGDGIYVTERVMHEVVGGTPYEGPDWALRDRIIAAVIPSDGGDDRLFGGAGNDRLIGGVGSDMLDGGLGNDQMFGDTDTSNVPGNRAWLPPDYHGADTLAGGEGNDYLLGGGGADILLGGAGNDLLVGDQFDAGASAIAMSFQGNDWLDGGDGNDILRGDGGNDSLAGGETANRIEEFRLANGTVVSPGLIPATVQAGAAAVATTNAAALARPAADAWLQHWQHGWLSGWDSHVQSAAPIPPAIHGLPPSLDQQVQALVSAMAAFNVPAGSTGPFQQMTERPHPQWAVAAM